MSADVGQLASPLREGVRYGQAKARREGRTVPQLTSGCRTRAEQVEARRRNCGPTDYDLYQRPASQCDPDTAIPGTSRHETCQAADIGPDDRTRGRLYDDLRPFGFRRPVPGESWHFEPPNRPAGEVVADIRDAMFRAGWSASEVIEVLASGNGIGLSDLPNAAEAAVNLTADVTTFGLVTDVPGALRAIGAAAGFLTDPDNWKRLGLVLGGLVLIIVGIIPLVRRQALDLAKGALT